MAAIAPARIALAWRTGPRARPGLPRRMPAASVPPEGKGKGTRGTGRVRHRYPQVAGAGPRRRTRAAVSRVRSAVSGAAAPGQLALLRQRVVVHATRAGSVSVLPHPPGPALCAWLPQPL